MNWLSLLTIVSFLSIIQAQNNSTDFTYGICNGVCISSTYLNTDSQLCSECLPNCLHCNDSSTCTTCNSGYYLDSSKTCQPCSSGCSSCEDSNVCLTCKDNYYLDSNKICQKCAGDGQNCKSCLTSGICTICGEGYVLSGTNCYSCEYTGFGCATCPNRFSDGTCDSCKSGFRLQGGQCIACPDNCVACSSTGACTKCKDEYRVTTSGACVQCPTLDPFGRCPTCNATGCTSCYSGFSLNNNQQCAIICDNRCTGCIVTSGNSTKIGLGIGIGVGVLAVILIVASYFIYKKIAKSKKKAAYKDVPKDSESSPNKEHNEGHAEGSPADLNNGDNQPQHFINADFEGGDGHGVERRENGNKNPPRFIDLEADNKLKQNAVVMERDNLPHGKNEKTNADSSLVKSPDKKEFEEENLQKNDEEKSNDNEDDKPGNLIQLQKIKYYSSKNQVLGSNEESKGTLNNEIEEELHDQYERESHRSNPTNKEEVKSSAQEHSDYSSAIIKKKIEFKKKTKLGGGDQQQQEPIPQQNKDDPSPIDKSANSMDNVLSKGTSIERKRPSKDTIVPKSRKRYNSRILKKLDGMSIEEARSEDEDDVNSDNNSQSSYRSQVSFNSQISTPRRLSMNFKVFKSIRNSQNDIQEIDLNEKPETINQQQIPSTENL